MNNQFDNNGFDNSSADNNCESNSENNSENNCENVTESSSVQTDGINADVEALMTFEEQSDEAAWDAEIPRAVDIAKERRTFSRLGIGLSVFTLIVLVSSFILQMLVLYLIPDFYTTTLFQNMLAPVCIYVIALPVLLIFIGRMDRSAPVKNHMGFGAWMLILLICFGFMYIGSYLGNFIMMMFSQASGYDYNNALNTLIDYDKLWISAIFLVIVAPIGEEFIFRKLIIDRMGKYGCEVSVLVSGFTFGLMHGNFYQFFYAFALGCILAYVYYCTGRVWLTIAIHAVINFVGGVLTAYMQRGMDAYYADMEGLEEGALGLDLIIKHGGTIVAMLLYLIFTFGTMICAIVLPIVLRKKIKVDKGEVQLPEFDKYAIVFGNVGMILMIVVFGIEFILNLIPA